MKSEKCIQFKYGPTPCFRDVNKTPCSVDYCPADQYLASHLNLNPFSVLHTHCVMSDTYGFQRDYEDGKGEYFALISTISKSK